MKSKKNRENAFNLRIFDDMSVPPLNLQEASRIQEDLTGVAEENSTLGSQLQWWLSQFWLESWPSILDSETKSRILIKTETLHFGNIAHFFYYLEIE